MEFLMAFDMIFQQGPFAVLTLVLLGGLQQPPNSFRPGAQNRVAKG